VLILRIASGKLSGTDNDSDGGVSINISVQNIRKATYSVGREVTCCGTIAIPLRMGDPVTRVLVATALSMMIVV
jgi:hypothetical protein